MHTSHQCIIRRKWSEYCTKKKKNTKWIFATLFSGICLAPFGYRTMICAYTDLTELSPPGGKQHKTIIISLPRLTQIWLSRLDCAFTRSSHTVVFYIVFNRLNPLASAPNIYPPNSLGEFPFSVRSLHHFSNCWLHKFTFVSFLSNINYCVCFEHTRKWNMLYSNKS